MSATKYLIRPQPLHRRPQNDGVQALSELVDVIVLFVREQAEGGDSIQKIEAALQTGVNALRADLETRLQTSGVKIRTWFQPVLDTAREGIEASQGTGSFDGFLNTVDVILLMARQALEHLSADELATKLNEICDILENDLGLSQQQVEQWFSDFIENAIQSLTADYLGGNASPEALRQFHLGAKLGVLRGLLLDLMAQIPDFDRRALVRDLAEMLKSLHWDETLERLREYGTQASEALSNIRGSNAGNTDTPGAAAAAPAPRQVAAPPEVPGAKSNVARSSVGKRDVGPPSAKQYSWYASWFFESQFGFEAGKLDNRFQLDAAALEQQLTFKQSWLSADFLENWAHWTAVGEDAGAALWHVLTRRTGNEANDWAQFGWHLTHGLTRVGGGYLQDSDGWVTFFKMWENYFFRMGLATVGAGFAGIQNSPDKFVGWLHARFLPNWAKTLLYELWLQHIRQFTLSFFTLVNHDPNTPSAQNYQKTDGFALPFVHAGILLGAWLPSVLWEKRKHYGFPFSDNAGSWASLVTYWVLGGVGLSFVGGLAGWALGGAISGKLSDDYWGKAASWQLPLLGVALWPAYTWLLWEGETDGGKWGLDAAGNVKTFAGYAARDNSPYRLPFPSGTLRQCVQGHHGVWSHNAKTEQLYALDFAMPYGDEILAMRGGTVVNVRDHIEDDSSEQANRIIIRHDDPAETTTPDPVHDLGYETGNPPSAQVAVTYAEYMHGRTGGIRLALATNGIPESAMVGSRVRQGSLIMLAGNTGRSAYNHLHVHVMTSAPDVRPYTTVPWVVREVPDNQGAPLSYRFYTSENTRSALESSYALIQPYDVKGTIRAAGGDWVELSAPAGKLENQYKDCHILVQFTNSEDQTFFQYRKISGYTGGDQRRVTVDVPWDSPLPANARYEIGAKPFAQAAAPWLNFTFLADRDAGGNALPFDGGRDPGQTVKIAHFSRQTFRIEFSGGNAADNFITWKEAGSAPEVWVGRSLVVERNGVLILYRRITAFDVASKRIEVDEPWRIPLDPVTDVLYLGALSYAQASETDKASAFLADGQDGPPRTVNDFPDGRKPYLYLNFKLQP